MNLFLHKVDANFYLIKIFNLFNNYAGVNFVNYLSSFVLRDDIFIIFFVLILIGIFLLLEN